MAGRGGADSESEPTCSPPGPRGGAAGGGAQPKDPPADIPPSLGPVPPSRHPGEGQLRPPKSRPELGRSPEGGPSPERSRRLRGEPGRAGRSGIMGESALEPGPVPGAPAGGPVHAVTVVTLLEKLASMLEALRERQGGLAQRQGGLAGSVRRIQSGLGALSRSHDTTSNTLAQLLAKAERVGSHADAAQERAVRRAAQVQRLEANHGLLVARGKLHVLLFKVSDRRRPRSGAASCLRAAVWGSRSRPPATPTFRTPPVPRLVEPTCRASPTPDGPAPASLTPLRPAWPITAALMWRWPRPQRLLQVPAQPFIRVTVMEGHPAAGRRLVPLWPLRPASCLTPLTRSRKRGQSALPPSALLPPFPRPPGLSHPRCGGYGWGGSPGGDGGTRLRPGRERGGRASAVSITCRRRLKSQPAPSRKRRSP